MLSRAGSSLAELLVALTIAAIVLASATGSLLRQQRTSALLVTSAQTGAQLHSATAVLPAQLALHDPSAGDIVAGEARDSSLQFRAPVATGLACDTAMVVTFAADGPAAVAGGVASTPRLGDTLWWYQADSSRWMGRSIVDAWTDSTRCRGAELGGAPPLPRAVVHLRTGDTDTVPLLTPLRITRQTRLAVYRAGDGTWQLGLREWSGASNGFPSPQPLAGPFLRVATDGARTGFTYFDASGIELQSGQSVQGQIARIRFVALGVLFTLPGRTLSSERDSGDVALRTDPPP